MKILRRSMPSLALALAIGLLPTISLANDAHAKGSAHKARLSRKQDPQQARPPVTTPQTGTGQDAPRQATSSTRTRNNSNDPDVLLDVPNVSVDSITLEVDNLQAHLALEAKVLSLLNLTAGVDASIGKVKLTIKGVRAQVLLKVRLDNVRDIVDRVMTTLDRNPHLVDRLLQTVDNTVNTVGTVGGQALNTLGPVLNNVTAPNGLLSQTVNTLGQTVQRTVDTTGNIVQSTLDTTGKILDSKTLGERFELARSEPDHEQFGSGGQTITRHHRADH